KSTLLNAILGQKVSIISSKPQTTRNAISGILTREDAQFIFVDTPGIHKPHHELGRSLNKSAYSAMSDTDIILLIVDASKPYGTGDEFLLNKIKHVNTPCFLLLNKIDLLSKEELLKLLEEWSARHHFQEIIPISAFEKKNLPRLFDVLKKYLPEGPKYFPDEMISDHGEQFQMSELIREKVLYKTEEEVPHSIAVVIEQKEEDEEKVHIHAMIIVERMSQKGILIGKQGAMIRDIRIASQRELKKMLGKKVELELFVRVEKNWRNRTNKLQQFGYHEIENL
ncbi:MAG: GTPase Era, partial [Erysipelotrichaceae bacterium]|nr:GTPase Era [Erysipelotrichaceae bacterium]